MNAIPVLTIEDVAALDGVLGDFLKKTESDLTVVIDRGGIVRYANADPDYTVRPEPAETIAVLKTLV